MGTFDRLLLALVGTATTIAGGWALATGLGVTEQLGVRALPPPRQLLATLRNLAASTTAPWWMLVLPAAVLVTAFGSWLAGRQLRTQQSTGPGTVIVEDTPRGRTTLQAGGLGRAVARDVKTVAGIHDASVTIHQLDPQPAASLRVRLATGTSPTQVRTGLEAALQRLIAALDADGVEASFVVDFTNEPQPRVR